MIFFMKIILASILLAKRFHEVILIHHHKRFLRKLDPKRFYKNLDLYHITRLVQFSLCIKEHYH